MRNWNGKRVSVSFIAPGWSISGLGRVAGTFFAVAKDNDAFTKENDGYGAATRVRNNNAGGRLTLTFAANAPVNQQLDRAHKQDLESETVVGALTLVDANTGDVVEATAAYIARSPDMSKSMTARGEKAWTFDAETIVERHGDGGSPVGGTG